jgi:hypothetical protein
MTNEEENAIGALAEYAAKYALSANEYVATSAMGYLRNIWPKVANYFKRQIIVTIEVELALDGRGSSHNNDYPLPCRAEWENFVKEMRLPKAAFTLDYRCSKCKLDGLKLWRGVHGCVDKDENTLKCAACLVPDTKVGDDGRAQEKGLHGMRTDQVSGWLPAVPVDDTFWGYTSVPSADCEWWRALPTYRGSE